MGAIASVNLPLSMKPEMSTTMWKLPYRRVWICNSCESFQRGQLPENDVIAVGHAANNCDRRLAAIALAIFKGNVANAALTLISNDRTSEEGIRIHELMSKCACEPSNLDARA